MKVENNEQALLQGLANNDRKSIEAIYKDNYNMVQILVINNNGSADEAKDIFQEAIIVLYEKVRSGVFELNCQIRTYVYSISKRLWLKRLQQLKRYNQGVESLEEVVPVEDVIEEHEKRNAEFEMMNKAISNLGEPCKSLLEAYYLQKKTMQEIADNFGYTNAANAKTQKYKCLMRLKKIFFTHYNDGNGNE